MLVHPLCTIWKEMGTLTQSAKFEYSMEHIIMWDRGPRITPCSRGANYSLDSQFLNVFAQITNIIFGGLFLLQITKRNASLFLAILLNMNSKSIIRIIEVNNGSSIHHHDISFNSYELSGMRFGATRGELFLVFIFSRNIFQKTSFTHFEVYHWGGFHFNPVMGNYHQRVTTNGAKDLEVWEVHGSLKIAILDNDHMAANFSKVLVLTLHISYDGKSVPNK